MAAPRTGIPVPDALSPVLKRFVTKVLLEPNKACWTEAEILQYGAAYFAHAVHECLMRAIHAKDEKEAIGLVAAVKSAGLLEACAASAEGRTALEEAAMYNFHALAKTLLDHGAEAAKEGNQPKALFCAIEAGSADTAALLVAPSLAAGALEWKFKRPDGEFTALMTAEELLNDPERADQKAAYQAIIAAIKSASRLGEAA